MAIGDNLNKTYVQNRQNAIVFYENLYNKIIDRASKENDSFNMLVKQPFNVNYVFYCSDVHSRDIYADFEKRLKENNIVIDFPKLTLINALIETLTCYRVINVKPYKYVS